MRLKRLPYVFSATRVPGSPIESLSVLNPTHTPYTKLSGQVDSSLRLTATRLAPVISGEGRLPKGWVELTMTETTTSPRGKVASRTLSIQLETEQAQMMADFIRSGYCPSLP